MERTEYSETSAYKIQTPGNYPEENIQHISGSLLGYWPIAIEYNRIVGQLFCKAIKEAILWFFTMPFNP